MKKPTMAAQASHNKQATPGRDTPVRLTHEQVVRMLYHKATKEILRRHFPINASDEPPRRCWMVGFLEGEDGEDGVKRHEGTENGSGTVVVGGVQVWATEVSARESEGEVHRTCNEAGPESMRSSGEREADESADGDEEEDKEEEEIVRHPETLWCYEVDWAASDADRASHGLEPGAALPCPSYTATFGTKVQAKADAEEASSEDGGESVISDIIGCYLDPPETDGSDQGGPLSSANDGVLERLLPGVTAAAGYEATEGTKDEGAGSVDSDAHCIPRDPPKFVISNSDDESGSSDESGTEDEDETWVRAWTADVRAGRMLS